MSHKLVPNLGHIGGHDSPFPGARRSVAACDSCNAFRRDNGTLGRLDDAVADAPAVCPGRPQAQHVAEDPEQWSAEQWRQVIALFREPDARELEMQHLREQVRRALTPGPRGIPRSFSAAATRSGSLSGVQAIAPFFATLRAIADPNAAPADLDRLNGAAFRILDSEGATVLGNILADFCRDRDSDAVKFYSTDVQTGAIAASSWAWTYVNAINDAYERFLEELPPTQPLPALLPTMATVFRWPTHPTGTVIDMRPIRLRAAVLHVLHILDPGVYAPIRTAWVARLKASVVAAHYDTVVLGAANMHLHKNALLTTTKHAPAKRDRRDRSAAAAPPKQKQKRGKSGSASGPAAPPPTSAAAAAASTANNPQRSGSTAPTRPLYDKCTSCSRKMPDGRLSYSPICRPCTLNTAAAAPPRAAT